MRLTSPSMFIRRTAAFLAASLTLLLICAAIRGQNSTASNSARLTVEAPPLFVDQANGTARQEIRLINRSNRPLPISLRCAIRYDIPSGASEHLPPPELTFCGPGAQDGAKSYKLAAPLEVEKEVAIQMHVTGVWEQGKWDITLFNNGQEIHKLKLINNPFPPNVSLAAPAADSSGLLIRKGSRIRLMLKNGDKKFLSLQSWRALCSSRHIMRQIREGVFAEDIEADFNAGGVYMEIETRRPLRFQPVRFRAIFYNDHLNDSAARDEFVCIWTFKVPDQSVFTEKGWEVSHYFPSKGEYEVTAYFARRDGEEKKPDANSFRLKEHIQVHGDNFFVGFKDRYMTEAIRIMVVLVAALVGLLAGAKEKLLSMDVLPGLAAVFLLGFGADQIKKLLTQRQ
ncbi:MAG TPA: hypothetical protein VNO14_09495 [Blastocatellia bacterium]|nr:hypothetical protein [Blastocatellia bacterium]